MAKDEALPEEGAEEAPKKKKIKKLPLIIGGVVALAIAGGGGFAYLRMKQVKAAKAGMQQVELEHKPAVHDDHPPIFLPLDNFTINLADTQEAHYLQLGMVFEVADLKAGEEIKNYMPVIRSRILLLLSGKTSEQLGTAEGKRQLAKEVLELTRERIPEPKEDKEKNKGIREVHFASFVIQ